MSQRAVTSQKSGSVARILTEFPIIPSHQSQKLILANNTVVITVKRVQAGGNPVASNQCTAIKDIPSAAASPLLAFVY